MNKKFVAGCIVGVIAGFLAFLLIGFFIIDNDLLDDLPDFSSSKKSEVKVKTTNKAKSPKLRLFGPKVNITKNKTKTIEYKTFNNGLFSMKIPKNWVVGVANSDYIHYTFMAYDPQNPDYKIFFNMKTEGYLKTQEMRNFYKRYYPTAPFAILPVINPQTTESFYKIYTQAFSINQKIIPFKVPVIKNFSNVQKIGKNLTGGSIVRAVYQNEHGKKVEGIFTATIKEVSVPPVVILNVYNTIYFTAPEGELVDWMPILNECVGSIEFSNKFVTGYYQQQGQVVQNAKAIQEICNQTSDIITSGWNERQKTYDIISQKQSDATMGYERVRDTDTGEIYKATVGFSDHDWHGKYEPITDDMYNLPTAGYIEKE